MYLKGFFYFFFVGWYVGVFCSLCGLFFFLRGFLYMVGCLWCLIDDRLRGVFFMEFSGI